MSEAALTHIDPATRLMHFSDGTRAELPPCEVRLVEGDGPRRGRQCWEVTVTRNPTRGLGFAVGDSKASAETGALLLCRAFQRYAPDAYALTQPAAGGA